MYPGLDHRGMLWQTVTLAVGMIISTSPLSLFSKVSGANTEVLQPDQGILGPSPLGAFTFAASQLKCPFTIQSPKLYPESVKSLSHI